MIYSGVVSGGLIYNYLDGGNGGAGNSISANALIGMLSVSCRVPNDKCEITWVPTEWDSNWVDPSFSTSPGSQSSVQEIFNKTNFVIMGWLGAQAVNESVGVMETVVSIIEENPTSTVYVQNSAHINTAGLTGGITKIISVLQKKDTAWYVNTFKKIGSFGLAAMRAYARGGALGLVSEIAGLNLAPRRNISS
jgi:hypothetical protein